MGTASVMCSVCQESNIRLCWPAMSTTIG